MNELFEATTLASALAIVGSGTQNTSSLTTINYSIQQDDIDNSTTAANISEELELKLLNFPSKREDLSTAIPLTVIFALLLITGCIGNLCTAIVIAKPKNKYMHTATNYYLFSLAMSDFLFLILGLPQEMYTLWQRYPYAFGESFCIIRGYLSEASTYASILTISAFTIERYVAICHPLWAHTMSQLPRAITSIVIIWTISAICAIPPAAELGIVTQKGPLTNKTLEESAQCATKRTIYENMFVVSAIVFFIVPMIIVTVLYILIAIELRRSSRMNSAISKQTSSQLNRSVTNDSTIHYHTSLSSCKLSNHSHPNHDNHHHHHHRHHHHSSNHNHHHHHYHNQEQQQQLCNHRQLTNYGENRQHAKRDNSIEEEPLTSNSNNSCNESTITPYNQTIASRRRENYQRTKSPSLSLCVNVVGGSDQASKLSAAAAAAAVSNNTPISNGQRHQSNLMTSILSQRPSSAIGTERLMDSPTRRTINKNERVHMAADNDILAQLTRLKRAHLSLWPLFWSNNNNKQLHRPRFCCCCCQHLSTGTSKERCGNGIVSAAVVKNSMPTVQTATATSTSCCLQQSQSQLYPRVTLNAPPPTTSPEASLELTRQHSPLSYHESLIQRSGAGQQLLAAAVAARTPRDGDGPLFKHQQHQFQLPHQMSLPHSPSIQSNASAQTGCPFTPTIANAGAAACQQLVRNASNATINSNHNQHYHQQMYHNNLSQQHQHQHQHQHNQTSRRSTAASSKKSVVRMLVAVVVSFFICWVPFHAQRLLASYLVKQENRNQLLLDTYLKLTYISGVMYYLSSTINPLLYQLMSAKFRLAFKETFHCSLFKCAMFLRGSNSNLTTKSSLKQTTTQNNTNHHHHHFNQLNQGLLCRCHCHDHDNYKHLNHSHQLQHQHQHQHHHHHHQQPLLSSEHSRNKQQATPTSPQQYKPKPEQPFPLGSNSNLILATNGSNNLISDSKNCSNSTCHLNGISATEQARFDSLSNQGCQNHYFYSPVQNPTIGFNVINRLRSKLNTSLVSLFRLQSTECALCASLAFSHACLCCSAGDHLNGTCGQQQQTDTSAYNQASPVQFARCMSPKGTDDNHRKQSQSSSTPLLVDHQHQQSNESEKANKSAKFSAHSMLKLIKTPQISSGNKFESNELQQQQQRLEKQQQALNMSSSRDEEEKFAKEVEDKMGALIKATHDSGVEETPELNDRIIILTSESGADSSSSSPDQQQVSKLARDQHIGLNERVSLPQVSQQKLRRQKVSSCSSNGNERGSGCRNSFRNNNNNTNVSDRNSKRRRASYHQQIEVPNNYQFTISGGKQQAINNNIGFSSRQFTRENSSDNSSATATDQHPKSSSSNKHLSSSLSSSERQLNEKLSISTTTSAVEDCTSLTTTNSQLTSSSNPTLGNLSNPQSEQSSSAIEEDLPTTVLNVVNKYPSSPCQDHSTTLIKHNDKQMKAEVEDADDGAVEDEDDDDDDEDDEEDDDDDESIGDNVELSKLPLLTKSISANNSQCHYVVESNRITE